MAEIKKPLLVFQGPVATRSGYGDHARDLLKSLISLDKFDIVVISTRWGATPMTGLSNNEEDKKILDLIGKPIERKPDVYIQVTVANEFEPKGTYNIGITAGVETTAAPIEFIHGCNKMDLVIVPSQFTKDVLLKTNELIPLLFTDKNEEIENILMNIKEYYSDFHIEL